MPISDVDPDASSEPSTAFLTRAAVISAAMMCDFLGEADAAARMLNAVDKTDDVEGTTSQIGDAIAAAC